MQSEHCLIRHDEADNIMELTSSDFDKPPAGCSTALEGGDDSACEETMCFV